jgi:hypothetical protein
MRLLGPTETSVEARAQLKSWNAQIDRLAARAASDRTQSRLESRPGIVTIRAGGANDHGNDPRQWASRSRDSIRG